jgi:hypothetical protein
MRITMIAGIMITSIMITATMERSNSSRDSPASSVRDSRHRFSIQVTARVVIANMRKNLKE